MTAAPLSQNRIASAFNADLCAEAEAWFSALRDDLCAALERVEAEGSGAASPATFTRTRWQRDANDGSDSADGGGGEMALMRGAVFEKAGVNVSAVHGVFAEDFRDRIPGAMESDGKFWASGISVVVHPRNPYVPAIHMNTRCIVTSHGWFGGGIDLTPMLHDTDAAREDAATLHAALKAMCDAHDPDHYARFSAWCDTYFTLPHRGERRGAGGIFFDQLRDDPVRDFAFIKDVGQCFLDLYPAMARRRMATPWNEQDRARQLKRRGLYAEFNLLYDRGTLFGLKTGGNIDAIFMSLPPEAQW